jgi:hypothetical protein
MIYSIIDIALVMNKPLTVTNMLEFGWVVNSLPTFLKKCVIDHS